MPASVLQDDHAHIIFARNDGDVAVHSAEGPGGVPHPNKPNRTQFQQSLFILIQELLQLLRPNLKEDTVTTRTLMEATAMHQICSTREPHGNGNFPGHTAGRSTWPWSA